MTARSQPRDGASSGRLQVRGPWVIRRYFQDEQGDCIGDDDWFDTGDVAVIHPCGTLQITDRSKDVIKSGGEWISSVELENAAVGCPGVAEAAAIGVKHPKWDERPLLLVVRKAGRGRDRRGRSAPTSPTMSPNGGCPTRSCSSTACRTPPPASCSRPRCATNIATMRCRAPDAP